MGLSDLARLARSGPSLHSDPFPMLRRQRDRLRRLAEDTRGPLDDSSQDHGGSSEEQLQSEHALLLVPAITQRPRRGSATNDGVSVPTALAASRVLTLALCRGYSKHPIGDGFDTPDAVFSVKAVCGSGRLLDDNERRMSSGFKQ